jgi:hypothetical protein
VHVALSNSPFPSSGTPPSRTGNRTLVRVGILVAVVLGSVLFAHHAIKGSPSDNKANGWFQNQANYAYEVRAVNAMTAWQTNAQAAFKLPVSAAADRLLGKGTKMCRGLSRDLNDDATSLPPTEPLRHVWIRWKSSAKSFAADCLALPASVHDKHVFLHNVNTLLTNFQTSIASSDNLVTIQQHLAKRLGLHVCGDAYCG